MSSPPASHLLFVIRFYCQNLKEILGTAKFMVITFNRNPFCCQLKSLDETLYLLFKDQINDQFISQTMKALPQPLFRY
jgi:hypothetical protein